MPNNKLRNIFVVLTCSCLVSYSFADIIDDLEDLDQKPVKTEDKSNSQAPKKVEKTQGQPKEQSNPKPNKQGETVPAQKKDVDHSEAKKSTIPDEIRRRMPINLKSDGEASYSKDGGTVFLQKNVRISQGNLMFRSDEAQAFFVTIGGENVVQRVEVIGNVNMSKNSLDPSENVKASGDRAFFYNDKGMIELVGNARLWQGGHLIRGQKITYDVNSSIVKVDRAEGVVSPGD